MSELKNPPDDDHGLPFGNISVHYHTASDRYYLVSRELDGFGVPLFEVQVNRATIDGQDMREEVAVSMWEAMIAEHKRFLEIQEEQKGGTDETPG